MTGQNVILDFSELSHALDCATLRREGSVEESRQGGDEAEYSVTGEEA